MNGYRVRHLIDNDVGYDYDRPPEVEPRGNYEVELVVQKIRRPQWADQIVYSDAVQQSIERLDLIVYSMVAETLRDPSHGPRRFFDFIGQLRYFTPWVRLHQRFAIEGAPELDHMRISEAELRAAVRPLLDCLTVDDGVYGRHGDLRAAIAKGTLSDLTAHWRSAGYFEGRIAQECAT